jgi:hypothetical protein
MNSLKTIIVAFAVSVLSFSAMAQAGTVKPLQAVSFHTATKDAVAYFLAEKGACKVVVTLTNKSSYDPSRVEQVVNPGNPSLQQLDDASALEFACSPEAQALSINVLEAVAQH